MIIHKLWRFLNNMCINLNVVTWGAALSLTMRKEDEDKLAIKENKD